MGYEVKTGSLSVGNVYQGIALRQETIVMSTDSGYINYYAREGERVGSGKLVCSIDEAASSRSCSMPIRRRIRSCLTAIFPISGVKLQAI